MELLHDPVRVREDAARRDQQRLQGVWNWVSGRRQAQLLVAGRHFTVRFLTGDIYIGTFRLDPLSHPRTIDLRIDEGPEHHRDKLSQGIYEFDGDHLIWCPGTPGNESRPRAFPADDDFSHLCLVLKREKLR